MKTGPQTQAEVLDFAAGIITELLGPAEHPDVAVVLDTIQRALDCQRRLIVREIKAEARLGIYGAPRSQTIDYAGGLRRAATIAKGGA